MKKMFAIIVALASMTVYGDEYSNDYMIEEEFQVHKILSCTASGTKNGVKVFDLKLDVHNMRNSVQGITNSTNVGGVKKIESLTVVSNDLFQNNFTIILSVKHGDKIIENETLSGLSLKTKVKSYGISKNVPGYSMEIVCKK